MISAILLDGSPTRDPMGYEFLPWPSIERVGAEG
jgi:hypothetical protein